TYPIMKHIQPVRKQISTPTIFNITGPLINPFKLDYQVMGVYETSKLEKSAHTLADLGRKRAIVMHGANGMDEATLSGDNIIYE
ncbi:anthranilate phosphoribosyltransferase, partial [Staphylococcus pasteuri]